MRGHGVDAGVPGAHQGHSPPGARFRQGLLGADRFLADGRRHHLLGGAEEIPALVDVGPVADDQLRPADGGGGGGRPVLGRARSEADDREMAPGVGATGDGDGCPGRGSLGHHQLAAGARREQSRRLADARCSDRGADRLARGGNGDACQLLGAERPDAMAEGHDGGRRRPAVDGRHLGDRLRRQVGRGQGLCQQAGHLVGLGVGRGPDAGDERGGMEGGGARFEPVLLVGDGDQHPAGGVVGEGDGPVAGVGDPDSPAVAVEEGDGHRRDVAGGREARQLVEPGDADGVGGSGDDRLGAEGPGHVACQVVGAATVATAQGHREAARFVHADDRRVAALVGEEWGDDAHRGTGRQEQHEAVHVVPAGRDRLGGRAAVVFVGETAGERPAPGRDRDGQDLHDRGPQATKTGFSAARRQPPAGRRSPRLTATWTTCPSRSAAAAARSSAAKVATTAPPGRSRAEDGVENLGAAAAHEHPVGVGEPGQGGGGCGVDHRHRGPQAPGVGLDPASVVGAAFDREDPKARGQQGGFDGDAAAARPDIPQHAGIGEVEAGQRDRPHLGLGDHPAAMGERRTPAGPR